jgi:hypothetical protein
MRDGLGARMDCRKGLHTDVVVVRRREILSHDDVVVVQERTLEA